MLPSRSVSPARRSRSERGVSPGRRSGRRMPGCGWHPCHPRVRVLLPLALVPRRRRALLGQGLYLLCGPLSLGSFQSSLIFFLRGYNPTEDLLNVVEARICPVPTSTIEYLDVGVTDLGPLHSISDGAHRISIRGDY